MGARASKPAGTALAAAAGPAGTGNDQDAVDLVETDADDLSGPTVLADEEDCQRQEALQKHGAARLWLEEACGHAPFEATVTEEIETVRKLLRKKSVFTVRSRLLENNDVKICKRTFREFKRLDQELRNRFQGALLPPLPKPNLANAKLAETLALYVAELNSNPFFRSDAAFDAFCDSRIKKFSDKTVSSLAASSLGVRNWEEVLDSLPIAENSAAQVRQLGKEVAAMQATYTKLRDIVKKLQVNIKRQARDQREMTDFFERWSMKEETPLLLRGSVADPPGASFISGEVCQTVRGMLNNVRTISKQRADAFESESETFFNTVMNEIQFELLYLAQIAAMVAEVKTAFKRWVSATDELQNVHQKLINSAANISKRSNARLADAIESSIDAENASVVEEETEEKDSGSSDGQESRPGQTPAVVSGPPTIPRTKRLTMLEATARDKCSRVKRLIRGLLFEASRYSYERSRRTSKLLQQITAAQQGHLEGGIEACAKVLERLPDPPQVGPLVSLLRQWGEAGQAGANAGDASDPLALDAEMAGAAAAYLDNDGTGAGAAPPKFAKRQSLRVVYNFESEEADEVSLMAGDIVEVLDEEEEKGWCRVRKSSGEFGLAPASYLEPYLCAMEEEEKKTDDDGAVAKDISPASATVSEADAGSEQSTPPGSTPTSANSDASVKEDPGTLSFVANEPVIAEEGSSKISYTPAVVEPAKIVATKLDEVAVATAQPTSDIPGPFDMTADQSTPVTPPTPAKATTNLPACSGQL